MNRSEMNITPCADVSRFYSSSDPELERICIGHMRFDFGSGSEFWSSWQPHSADDRNDAAFKAEFNGLVKVLRRSMLKSRIDLNHYIYQNPSETLESGYCEYYGYRVLTEHYAFYLRCTAERGNYNYIYCYLREDADYE